jgi:hypothetical protein
VTACSAYPRLIDFFLQGALFDGVRCAFVGVLPAPAVAILFIASPILALFAASRRVIVPFVIVTFLGAALVTQLPAVGVNAIGIALLVSLVGIGYLMWQRVQDFR